MPQSVKKFYVEVGEHLIGTEALYDEEYYKPEADGLWWHQKGEATDSFPEVEARGALLGKTYKNVRLASVEHEIIAYVGD